MLSYLKYTHLDFLNETNRKTGIDKATQFPETRNKSTQTIDRPEKGVDTCDDFILQTDGKRFGANEKMVQATSVRDSNRFKQHEKPRNCV